MMYEFNSITKYPFLGEFIRYELNEDGEEVENVILSTDCDVQQVTAKDSGSILTSELKVYFEFNKEMGIVIRKGDTFRCYQYGLMIEGIVKAPYPNQLGGCEVLVSDLKSN